MFLENSIDVVAPVDNDWKSSSHAHWKNLSGTHLKDGYRKPEIEYTKWISKYTLFLWGYRTTLTYEALPQRNA